jgi:uroporphyrinogen III methyltransferase/synthase
MIRAIFTGPEDSLPGLEEAARALGLLVERRPLISFQAPRDWVALTAALANLDRFGAVALTSPRAAATLAARLRGGCAVPAWVPGKATAAALGGRVTRVHIVPSPGAGDAAAAVADSIIASGVNAPVLFPCGDRRREVLVARLEAAGLPVMPVVCYHTVLAGRDEARSRCKDAGALIVSSPSVARLLAQSIDPTRRPALVALGPTTATEAREAGWAPDATAAEPTVDGVIAALADVVQPVPFPS